MGFHTYTARLGKKESIYHAEYVVMSSERVTKI